jgi:hypothetical protein
MVDGALVVGGHGAGDRSTQAEAGEVETANAEVIEQLPDRAGHRLGGVTGGERRRLPVAGQIGGDQGVLARERREPASELLSGADETVAEHERLAGATDEEPKTASAEIDEPLLHGRGGGG